MNEESAWSDEALGLHRVLAPRGVLPQAAERLDPDPARKGSHELHIDVETLNVDSASFRQIEESVHGRADAIGEAISAIVARAGKLENPVTGSGGMLLGRLTHVGEGARKTAEAGHARVGDRVATLVSLTLTPLVLRAIRAVRVATHQVDVEGTAIVFSSGSIMRVPDDLPERLALGALDVAGAAPQVARLVTPGAAVLVLGCGGKSGLLAGAAAFEKGGAVVGVEAIPQAAEAARRIGHFAEVVVADARDPVATARAAFAGAPAQVRAQGGYDVVVSCVNVDGAEAAAILCARSRGKVYFFSMSTSFTRAALGAEGIGKDVDMLIGNGYAEGHAQATLELLRRQPALRAELTLRFAT